MRNYSSSSDLHFKLCANKLDFLVYTACTRVQTVSLDLYSCTGEMTPSIQVYTPDESTRAAIQPASLQMYSCECRAMCTARLCSTHHSRCTAVRTVSPGLCAGSRLTFFNNKFRVKPRPVNCRFGPGPSARGDLGVALRLGYMVVKISACIRPETHYFKGQPRTGEIVSTAAHRE